MAVLFAVFLNEQMMKTKTEINKQKKTDISTSERQLSANGCQHPYACSIIFFGNRCLWLLFLSLLGLLSINQAAEQKKQQQQTNKQNKTNNNNNKKKHTKNWCSSGLFFLLLLLLLLL